MREGDRVSTISLLGCSTSVILATGPTNEEEEEEEVHLIIFTVSSCKNVFSPS